MPSGFEAATSGRSKCRGCDLPIGKGEVRFGERLPNPFGSGELTLWFHPLCAAYKRPETMLQALAEPAEIAAGGADREALERAARANSRHPRLQRISGAELSPSGQAKCRSCHEPIEKGSWRIRLVFFEDGRFAPSGAIHVRCRKTFFETDEGLLEPVLHFSPGLSDEDRQDLARAFESTAEGA
jgi:hypothetical protein